MTKRKITPLALAEAVSLLPLGPLRSALIDTVGRHPDADTTEIAHLMGMDNRAALTNLTKMRLAGYLLTRAGTRTGIKGKPPVTWRLSVKGKVKWGQVEAAMNDIRRLLP